MKKNKILSLILALAMAFSLASPAFATTAGNEKEISVSSKLNEQTIKITMETAPGAVLNPYGLGYSSRGSATFQNFDQVASKDNLIVSQSTVPLDVAVKVTDVNAENDIILVEEDWTGADPEERQVYMYAVFANLDTSKLTPTSDPSIATALSALTDTPPDGAHFYPKDEATGAQMPINYPSGSNLLFEKSTNKAANAVLIPEEPDDDAEAQVVAHLDATNTTVTGTGGTATYTSKTISAVAYKMGGHMVAEPKDDNGPWGAADKVTFKLSFTFKPTAADTRQQKAWAQDFAIDIDNVLKINGGLKTSAMNVSVADFELYNFSNYPTEYAYGLSLLLPDGAKDVTVGASGKSGDIEEKHTASGAQTAFAAITGKKADVELNTSIDADLDGYVMIKAAGIREAAFSLLRAATAVTPEALKIPITVAFKLPTGASGADEQYTYTVNVLANPAAEGSPTALTRASDSSASLTAAAMKTALGVTGTLGSVNLYAVSGDFTDVTKIEVGGDGAVSIIAANVTGVHASAALYFTMKLGYNETDANGAVTSYVKDVNFKIPAGS